MVNAVSRVLEDGGLGTTSHSVPEELVARTLLEHYDLAGELTRVATEMDATFRCRELGGDREYLVKVSHPNEPIDIVHCQAEAVEHIAAKDPRIPVQRVRRTRAGSLWTALTGAGGDSQGVIRVHEFIPGTLLVDATPTPDQLQAVGAMLGRVDVALQDFVHVGTERQFVWNLTRFTEFASLIDLERDPHRRALARTVFAAFSQGVDPSADAARSQVIHGDFSPYNVVVDPDAPDFVIGVIDFGDIMRVPVVFDPAVMCGNHLDPAAPDPWASSRALLRGYRTVFPLDESEIELVALASLARITLRALVASWRLDQGTERGEYIMQHARDDWDRLERALHAGISAARRALHDASPHT